MFLIIAAGLDVFHLRTPIWIFNWLFSSRYPQKSFFIPLELVSFAAVTWVVTQRVTSHEKRQALRDNRDGSCQETK